jgi:hypothetical protein
MIDYAKLIENGFLELIAEDSEFSSIADYLGEIIPSRINGPDIDLIKPKPKEEAHPHSLSAHYGVVNFTVSYRWCLF